MKKGYTHIAVLLDRSGSMSSIKNDMIGGFNSFLDEQAKLDGECTISLAQFDDIYETVYDFVSIKEMPKLNDKNFVPRNSTALTDSFARFIKETGNKFVVMKEEDRPEKVLFVSITDGGQNDILKNTDKHYTSKELKELIEHQENKYNWQFTFIGANQDAFGIANSIGISTSNTMSYNSTSLGTQNMFQNFSAASVRYRKSSSLDKFSYTKEEQDETEATS